MSTTRIIQYLHRPNMTELGMGNTHESYMLINSSTDLSEIFPPAVEVMVKDDVLKKSYGLRSAIGREFRVNQMGELYRDHNILPGDEIIFTKIFNTSVTNFNVSVRKYLRVVVVVNSNDAEILNVERLDAYEVGNRQYEISINDEDALQTLKITFNEARQKRNDSPNLTNYYKITLSGEPLANGQYYITLNDHPKLEKLAKSSFNTIEYGEDIRKVLNSSVSEHFELLTSNIGFLHYITAIKSKPFLLLAGISGTGKSRIVRQLARSCWNPSESKEKEQYMAHKPKNYAIVQVKPNWHDSSELIGYRSNIGEKEYHYGQFLESIVKAWADEKRPYFFCLDEMNLAPVEQYFAEYLSVVETRKLVEGKIVTDAIIEPDRVYTDEVIQNYDNEKSWYVNLVGSLLNKAGVKESEFTTLKVKFLKEGIRIPQNFIVVGTVNMDETTYGFSRKVLDRAMTIEMNEVELKSGLTEEDLSVPYIESNAYVPKVVEACDVYKGDNIAICDDVISYLEKLNEQLDGTPFKIAYRTRNEFLVYVVNALTLAPEADKNITIATALDRVTSMKVLSRIEGDKRRVKELLDESHLQKVVKDMLDEHKSKLDEDKKSLIDIDESVSLKKLKSMQDKLNNGYTDYWD